MCKLGETTTVQINGKDTEIDSCIADIVVALNKCGIRTFESCCGHYKQRGTIFLEDGRELEIIEARAEECDCWKHWEANNE